MSRLSMLLQVTDEEKKAILKHYKISEEDFEDRIRILKEWVSKSEHLPQDNDDMDHKLRITLINSKMSMEKAKQSIEGYYRIRARYADELFNRIVPGSKDYLDGKRFVKTVVMPQLTADLCRITIFKFTDPDGEANDAFMYHILVIMMAEIRITKDLCLSNIIIFDLEEYGWKNLIKFTPVVNQKVIDIMLTLNLRIQAIHFINQPNIMDQVMRVFKAFAPAKIANRLYLHKDYESLTEHIPKEYLPSNYGGTHKSLEGLYDEWCEEIEDSKEMFRKLLAAKSTAKIELDSYQQNMFGCGAEGSFKQLLLD